MAKLPDIPSRGVQQLRAPAPQVDSGAAIASGLARGANRAANVFEQKRLERERDQEKFDAARKREMEAEYDKEARLDAGRRFLEAQRDYLTKRKELLTDYTTDGDLDPVGYREALETHRVKTFERATKGTNERTRQYLEPRLDAFRTQMVPHELDAEQSMVNTRTALKLDVSLDEMQQNVREDPDYLPIAVAGVDLLIEESGLYTPDKAKEAADATLTNLAVEAVNGFVGEGRYAAAAEVLDEGFASRLSPKVHAELTDYIKTEAIRNLNEVTVREFANGIVSGNLIHAQAEDAINQAVSAIPGLNDVEREQLRRNTQGDLVAYWWQNLSHQGRHDEVLEHQDSGLYSHLVDPDKAAALYKTAQDADARERALSIRKLQAEVQDQLKRALATGEYDDTALGELQDLAASGVLTDSQQQGIEMLAEQAAVYETYAPRIAQFADMSAAEIQQYVNTLPDLAAQDNFGYHATAQTAVRKAAQAHMEGRAEPGSYAIANNGLLRDSYNDLWQYADDPARFAEEYARFDQESRAYLERIGIDMTGKSTVPVGDVRISSIVAAMAGNQPQLTTGAVQSLVGLFGEDNALAMAQSYGQDTLGPTKVSAFLDGQTMLIDALARGQNFMAGLKAADEKQYNQHMKIIQAPLNAKMDPITAMELFGSENVESVMVGLQALTTAYMADGNMDAGDAATLAMETLVGPIFRLGGDKAVTYERNGVRVTPEDVRGRFLTMRRDMEQARLAGFEPYFRNADGVLEPMPPEMYAEALKVARFTQKEPDGTYYVELPHLAPGGISPGRLVGKDGEDLVVNFENVTYISDITETDYNVPRLMSAPGL